MRKPLLSLATALGLLVLSARSEFVTFTAEMDGFQVVPTPDDVGLPASPATGTMTLILDTATGWFDMTVVMEGLLGEYDPCALGICSGAHIHAGPEGTASTLHLYNTDDARWVNDRGNNSPRDGDWTYAATGQAFINGGDLDLLRTGDTYFNVHTSYITTGEIRGQITEVIPEPSTLLLVGWGALCLLRQRRSARTA